MIKSYNHHLLTNIPASSSSCSTHSIMKLAVIYARYSSENQTEQSIEGQLRVCQQYAKANDIAIVDTYIDRAMTGTNDNRVAFQQMIKDSEKQQWSLVLVYKLDRFSRNKYESVIHKKTLVELVKQKTYINITLALVKETKRIAPQNQSRNKSLKKL